MWKPLTELIAFELLPLGIKQYHAHVSRTDRLLEKKVGEPKNNCTFI